MCRFAKPQPTLIGSKGSIPLLSAIFNIMYKNKKFKVWDKILKKIIPFNGFISFEDDTVEIYSYTGLNDLNGNPIYENDVVDVIDQYGNKIDEQVVCFEYGRFGIDHHYLNWQNWNDNVINTNKTKHEFYREMESQRT